MNMNLDTNFQNTCGSCGSHSSIDGQSIEQGGRDILNTVKGGAVDIFDIVTTTGGFVVEEAKEGYDKVKEEGVKLDKKERIIKSIPNSYIVFGAIGLLIFSILKK
jgi:hypothetical protein